VNNGAKNKVRKINPAPTAIVIQIISIFHLIPD